MPQDRVRAKPTILAVAEVYLPGYLGGGPVRSLSHLIDTLGDEFHWKVITRDRDFHQAESYPGVVADSWVRVGKADVYYLGGQGNLIPRLLRLLRATPCDVVYLNSFFDPVYSIGPMIAKWLGMMPGRAVLLAPRGELSAGALGIRSTRKQSYLRIARVMGFYRRCMWHASTQIERDEIAATTAVPAGRIHVARNLSVVRAKRSRTMEYRSEGSLRICFLSRISRKKNLDFVLRIMARVVHRVSLTIYGPREDPHYWQECEGLIEALPGHVTACHAGPVPADAVQNELIKHDVFFLPTRGENFGHVFVEAWAAGLPVLTSDRTPWRGLEAAKVGWDLPLDDEAAFVRVIDDLAQWRAEQWGEARRVCIEFAEITGSDAAAVEENLNMFFRVTGSGA